MKNPFMRIREIIEKSDSAMFSVTQNGRFTVVNEKFASLFGYEVLELNGNSVSMLVPKDVTDKHDENIRKFFESGSGGCYSVAGVHKDGSEVLIDMMIDEVDVDGKKYALASVRYVNGRAELKKKVDDAYSSMKRACAKFD